MSDEGYKIPNLKWDVPKSEIPVKEEDILKKAEVRKPNWDGKKRVELSIGKKTEIVITIVLAIGIWGLGIIYVPLVRMFIVGAGSIGLGYLIRNKVHKPISTPLAYLVLLFLGAGYLLVGIVVLQWASWYMGFRRGY